MSTPSLNPELCDEIIAQNSTDEFLGEPEFSPEPRRTRRHFKPAPEKFTVQKPKCIKRQPQHHH